jgi:hypothetical protein
MFVPLKLDFVIADRFNATIMQRMCLLSSQLTLALSGLSFGCA